MKDDEIFVFEGCGVFIIDFKFVWSFWEERVFRVNVVILSWGGVYFKVGGELLLMRRRVSWILFCFFIVLIVVVCWILVFVVDVVVYCFILGL